MNAVLQHRWALPQTLVNIRESDALTHAILDSVSYQIAVLNHNGVIVAVNESWRRFAVENGVEPGQPARRTGMGVNYLEICRKAVGERSEEADPAYNGIQAVLDGRQSGFTLEYPCHAPHEQRWFIMRVTPLGEDHRGAVIIHADITARKQAEYLLTVQRDLLMMLEGVNNPVAAMQMILDAALSFAGVDSGGIYEVDPENGDLTLRVHYGFSPDYIAAVRIRASDSLAGMIVRAGQPHYSFINPPYPELPDYIRTEGLCAYAIIPILHDGQAIACFNLASHQTETIPATTCRALETLALQLGEALTRLKTRAALEEQRVNLNTVFDNLSDLLFILDEHGHILKVNPAVERGLGYAQQELLGRPVLEVHPPDRRAEAWRIVTAMLEGRIKLCPVPLLTRSGQQIPVETRVVPGQWSGRPALIGLSRDITERQQAEDTLRASESRFHTLVDLLPYGVQESDLAGRITFANPALERLHGRPENGLVGRFIWDFMADDGERESLRDYLQSLVREQPAPTPYFATNRRADGAIFDVQIDWTYRRDAHGQLQGFIAVVSDITERKRLQEALREQAIRDPLTGLFNRRYLDETLPRELSRCQRHNESLAVAMLDLDYFKNFNDAYGHAAGDRVLQAIGALLDQSLRASDIACRYGGEELVVVMPGSARDDARARLEEVRQALMKLHVRCPHGELPAVTLSVGITAALPAEANAAELLARADAALYQAKRQGRNQIVVSAASPLIPNPLTE